MNKKTAILIAIVLLLSNAVFMVRGEVAVDSYSETNYSAYGTLQTVHPSSGATASATYQCFNGTGKNLLAAQFYLTKNNAPQGYLKAALYNMTGTYGTNGAPTGTVLETSSTDLSMGTIATAPTKNLFTFNFTGTIDLVANGKYCIILYVVNATTIDATNYIYVGLDSSAPTHGGNRGYFTNSAWTADATKDLCFYIYGETPAPDPTPTPTNTPASTLNLPPEPPIYGIIGASIVPFIIIAAVLLAVITVASKIKPLL